MTERSRFYQIPGLHNVRDLGGFTVEGGVTRIGVLLRSEAPVDIESAGRRALGELGLHTAIDLRDPVERQLSPIQLGGLGIDVYTVPLFGGPAILEHADGLRGLYRDVLEQRGAQLSKTVEILSTPRALPAMLFCTAGKDRTGLVSALILSVLGVSDADIANDYALSESVLQGAFRATVVARARAAGLLRQRAAVEDLAPPELMLRTLADLTEREGSAVGYFSRHGVPNGRLAYLRAALVEGDCADSQVGL